MYSIALPKPTKKLILSLRYSIIKHHGSILLEWYCSCPKMLNRLAILFIRYPKNALGCITYLLKLGGALHNHTKT
jgi:hypothetical protein